MTLTERYHIIRDRLCMKSDAMLADFRSRGGRHRVLERSPEAAQIQIELTLDDQTQVFALSWDEARHESFPYMGKKTAVLAKLERGQTSDLTFKSKYATPRSRSQLWARVVSDGVRVMAPEVVAGYYTPAEITDMGETHATPPPATAGKPPAEDTPHEGPSADGPASTPTFESTGVSLSAIDTGTPYEQYPESPCGESVAEVIRQLARRLQLPPAKLQEIVRRSGVERLADLPSDDAQQLQAKLEGKLADQETPF